MYNCANSHNLIQCKSCEAVFDKTVKWVYGSYDRNDTTGNFYVVGEIPESKCPICRKECIEAND